MLSRLPEIDALTQNEICFENLKKEQENEILNGVLDKQFKAKYNIKEIEVPGRDFKILCEMTGNRPRPYIPQTMRGIIVEKIHSLAHPGVRSSRKILQKMYFWPRMSGDINQLVSECVKCQKGKVTVYTKSPNIEIGIPKGRFEHIHMDIVGPLPVSRGYRYLLTIIDRTSRWPEVYPLRNINSDTIVKLFIQNYVSRFGVPLRITVDRGTQFTSSIFSKLTKMLGIEKIHTSAYHPQSNGMIERFHRQLKTSITTSNDVLHWADQLPVILLGLRTSVKEECNCSPAEMVYGETIRIPGELVVPSDELDDINREFLLQKLRENFSHFRSVVSHHGNNSSYIPPNLMTCSYVFLKVIQKKGLQNPFEGPYRVIERTNKCFKIQKGNSIVSVAIDLLKPAIYKDGEFNENEVKNAAPKKRVTFNLN